ncbi:hypothetical protein ACMU_11360 [Actibacterium mucosum KCTC 23349]|uniref:Activator of Hsp90 ATPase homologue 1/2-like C-terminal domain-containing protein n=1 Tax=Actibacterium mucosum KCTC 23349 TaxID=1454373 RepID=A0A037ZI47_9RHOB|nr:SRPBCC family protein [Actibacterium mucosum]KAJ55289.1 hypothetical protein ACMU_11360 [Actibacterium mucosum KCTC 23349]
MTDTTISKSVFLPATRMVVWQYLTDPAKMERWFHPADAPLAEGQDYTLRNGRDGDRMCWGKVIEMRAPEYMKWDFTVGPMEGAMSTVEWHLADAPGGTRLTMAHAGLPETAEAFGLVLALDKGWHAFLGNLHVLAEADATGDYSATITVPATPETAKVAIFDEMDIWWSKRVDRSDNGVTVHFGGSHVSFDFAGDDDGGYHWHCRDANMLIEDVDDATEWAGTSLIWHIRPEPGGSRITLTHQGLNADLACHDVCTRGWQKYFETSLRAHLSGETPMPETR